MRNGVDVVPFLKWAGGKRWLVNSSRIPVPKSFNRYFEPFLGSGAVFFAVQPERAYLSDINEELIVLYCVMRDYPKELTRLMEIHHSKHCKDYYYRVRDRNPKDPIKKAARFLYLNRTCWNGLYRVNLQGKFNVPLGTKSSVILDTDDFLALSKMLSKANICAADFEKAINLTDENDLLFVDPPYTVQHNCNNFLRYNENIFSWSDQERLRNSLLRAKTRGVQIIITNADHPSVRELYKSVGEYHQLTRSSVLAGKKEKRGPTTEAMFLANIK